MKNQVINKSGISLVILAITVIVISILVTTVVINFNESGIIEKANETVDVTRFKELEHATSEIISDYHLLEENDEEVRSMSLKEYILQHLRTEYNLTTEEESIIAIDEEGNIKYID